MTRGAAGVAAGAGVLVGLAVALAATRHAPTTTASPLRPEGVWEGALVVGVVAAFVLYLAGLWLLRGGGALPAVLALAAAIQLAPLAVPLLLSSDAYTYWTYGRLGAVHAANPYETPPSAFPDDPAFRRMGATWRDTTSLYGPAFTLASEGHAAAVGGSARVASWTYKALAAVAMIAVVVLAALVAPRPAFAAAFVGWNPLLAFHFAGGGHNDAWMMALLLGGLTLAARGRANLGGFAWALAVGVKWVPLVLFPLFALARRGRGRSFGLAGFAGGLTLLAAAAFARYGIDWTTAFSGLSSQARRTGSLGLADPLGDLGLSRRAILVVLALAFAAVYAVLVRDAARGRARLGLAAGAFALAQGWLNPWYAVWALALAAIEDDRAARALALVLSIYLLRDALPL